MAYSVIQQLSLDINWYFTDRYNRLCVAASAGGILPETIIENEESNEEFHNIIMELPEKFKSARNDKVLDVIQGINDGELDSYFQNFESLAARGLYVYDRINLNVPENGQYVLVAYPIYDTRKDDFPLDKSKLSMIPKTNRWIISRLNQQVKDASFIPKSLIELIDHGNNSL